MKLIVDSLRYSAIAHNGQTRKGGDIPYVVHPYEVAMRAMSYTSSEEIIAAALLHDVVEDCGVSIEALTSKFGSKVASLVNEVTNIEEKTDDWRERKTLYCKHLIDISSDAAIIIACDKMANMFAYGEKYKIDPVSVEKILKHTHEEWKWYYGLVLESIKKKLPEKIQDDYTKMLQTYF
jgi:myo-inositol-1(or 4)-monophosphatase